MAGAIVLGPGEGKRLVARGSTIVFKAVAETTGGAFSLMEREIVPGSPFPPAHRHPGAEAFYILEGWLRFDVEGTVTDAGPGAFVLVPKGIGHTFGNASRASARLLIVHAPAADAYFEELQELWSGDEPPSPEAQRDLQRRHGWEPA